MLFSIAWRNIWRNKGRSLVVIIAVTLGLIAGIFTTAFMKGWVDQRMVTVLKTELSYIQVHHPRFVENHELKYRIDNIQELSEKIEKIPGVTGVSKRFIINAMASSAENGTGVMVTGVFPEQEKTVTDLYQKIIDGAYFEGVSRNPIVIGKKLADKLDVNVRKKIVLTFQDEQGNIVSSAFRVAGIFETNNNSWDGANVFVRYKDLASLTGVDIHQGHEIAISLQNNDHLSEITENIKALAPGLLVENWKSLSPEMAYMDELMVQYMYLIIVIILFALCFGIINTMLMAVLERVKELGMLMSIGMNKLKIFIMLMYEAVMLTLTGGVLGVILGYFVSYYFTIHPIDLSIWGEGLREMGYSPIIYAELDIHMIVPIIILVVLTGIVSSLYPAYKAIRLNPVEATKIE